MSFRVPYLQHGRRHGPNGSDPIIGSVRQSFGQMYDDGTEINTGSGDWTATETGDNLTITFAPEFSSPPAVVAIPNEDGGAGTSVVQISVDVASVVLLVVDDTGAAIDCGINFQAIAPI